MSDTRNAKHAYIEFGDEAQIGKMVFGIVRDAANLETVKIMNELSRQLDAIMSSGRPNQEIALGHLPEGMAPADNDRRVKGVVKQLFVYLVRVLLLNIARSISKHLADSVYERSIKVQDNDSQIEDLRETVSDYENRIAELSGRISGYEEKLREYRKGDEGAGISSYRKISESVDNLLGVTLETSKMLEDLSRRYAEFEKKTTF